MFRAATIPPGPRCKSRRCRAQSPANRRTNFRIFRKLKHGVGARTAQKRRLLLIASDSPDRPGHKADVFSMVFSRAGACRQSFAMAMKKTTTVRIPPPQAPGAQPGTRHQSAVGDFARNASARSRASGGHAIRPCSPAYRRRAAGFQRGAPQGGGHRSARSIDRYCGSTRAPSGRTCCIVAGLMSAALLRAGAPNPRPTPVRGFRLDTPAHTVRVGANMKNLVDPTDRQ